MGERSERYRRHPVRPPRQPMKPLANRREMAADRIDCDLARIERRIEEFDLAPNRSPMERIDALQAIGQGRHIVRLWMTQHQRSVTETKPSDPETIPSDPETIPAISGTNQPKAETMTVVPAAKLEICECDTVDSLEEIGKARDYSHEEVRAGRCAACGKQIVPF